MYRSVCRLLDIQNELSLAPLSKLSKLHLAGCASPGIVYHQYWGIFVTRRERKEKRSAVITGVTSVRVMQSDIPMAEPFCPHHSVVSHQMPGCPVPNRLRTTLAAVRREFATAQCSQMCTDSKPAWPLSCHSGTAGERTCRRRQSTWRGGFLQPHPRASQFSADPILSIKVGEAVSS